MFERRECVALHRRRTFGTKSWLVSSVDVVVGEKWGRLSCRNSLF